MIGKRALTALTLAFSALVPSLAPADSMPEFRLGFRLLADLIPGVVGEPLEEEHHNPLNGDGLQTTSTGLMVWRKADNWTAFTDGWRTWINGPYGVQERGNEERLDWEMVVTDESPPASSDSSTAPATEETPQARQGEAGLVSEQPVGSQPSETPGYLPDATGTPARATEPATAVPSQATAELPPTETAEPTEVPTSTSEVVPPAATATSQATATVAPPPTATRTAIPPAATTSVPGGVRSPEPAGAWVTSVDGHTKYYTTREHESRWREWDADNLIWFASEAALRAAYPDRIKVEPDPTNTPRPTATTPRPTATAPRATSTPVPTARPTSTPVPTQRPTGTPAPTSVPGGIVSPDPAGEWVTSADNRTDYYTTRSDSYWERWAPANRVWFASEAALLAAYPGRIRRK